jgi:hypothetical protein
VFIVSHLRVSDDDFSPKVSKAADVESGEMSSPGFETVRAMPEEKQ